MRIPWLLLIIVNIYPPPCHFKSAPKIFFKTHVVMCLDFFFLISGSVLITTSVHVLSYLLVLMPVHPYLPVHFSVIVNDCAMYPEDLYVFSFFLKNSCIDEPSAQVNFAFLELLVHCFQLYPLVYKVYLSPCYVHKKFTGSRSIW